MKKISANLSNWIILKLKYHFFQFSTNCGTKFNYLIFISFPSAIYFPIPRRRLNNSLSNPSLVSVELRLILKPMFFHQPNPIYISSSPVSSVSPCSNITFFFSTSHNCITHGKFIILFSTVNILAKSTLDKHVGNNAKFN